MNELIINTRCLMNNLTGVQRYTLEFLKHSQLKYKKLCPNSFLTGHLWEQLYLPIKSSGKLIFSPANSGPFFYKKQVITIHDLAVIDHPEWFNSKYVSWYRVMLPQVIKNSLHVITVSNYSKRRIIETYNINPQKITVINNGVSKYFLEPINKSDNNKFEFFGNRYFLSHSSIEPRKNLQMLIDAWEKIESKIDSDIYLLISGKFGAENVFQKNCYNIKSKRIKFIGNVTDAELKRLYSNALSFIYISLYEGFGLPPLEAMACGTPVIVSNNSSLPEVVGNMGIKVNPYNKNEIADAILLSSQNFWVNKNQLKKYVERYDWKITASQTDAILSQYI